MKLLLSTCTPADAERVLRSLLREKLVACGNLVPGVRSLYWWQGEICDDTEVVMLMETTDALADEAAQRLAALHPYEVPKILTLEPTGSHDDYTTWVAEVTRASARPEPQQTNGEPDP